MNNEFLKVFNYLLTISTNYYVGKNNDFSRSLLNFYTWEFKTGCSLVVIGCTTKWVQLYSTHIIFTPEIPKMKVDQLH